MAIAKAVDILPDAAMCSICWEIFKEPVTLNCGHNYCKYCISRYWDGSRVVCPQCKETYACKTFQLNQQLGTIASQLQQLRLQHVVFVTREEKFGLCKDHQQPLVLFCKDDGVFVCSVCERSELHGRHLVASVEMISKDYKLEIKALLELQKRMRADMKATWEDLRMEKQNVVRILDEGVEKVSRDYKELLELVRKVQGEQVTLAKEIEKEIDEELYKFHKKRQELKKLQSELEKKLELDPYEFLKDIKETMSKCQAESFDKLESALPVTKDKLWELSRSYLFIQNTLIRCHDTLLLKPMVEKAMVTLNPVTSYPRLLISEDLKTVTYNDSYYNLMTHPLGFDMAPCVLGSEGFTAGRHRWEVEIISEEDEGWALGIAKESVKRKGDIALHEGEGIWALQPKSSSLLWKDKVRIQVYLHYEEGQLEFFDSSSKELITTIRAMWLDGEKVFPFFMLRNNHASMRLCF